MAELPFVEKYRPESLKDLCGNSNIRKLHAFVVTGQMPLALVMHGIFGTGKTTAAKAFTRDYYIHRRLYSPDATWRDIRSGAKLAAGFEGLFPPILYVDAAITRDIDTIRGLVRDFMRTRGPKGMVKFVIFDEADRLLYDAQGVLRSLIEKFPNTRTIYTANVLNKIDPAIRSRAAGAIMEFVYPSVDEVAKYLQVLVKREGVEIPAEKLQRIARESKSLREAVGQLGSEVSLVRLEKMPVTAPGEERRKTLLSRTDELLREIREAKGE